MTTIRLTDEFRDWLKSLKDKVGAARIVARLDRLAAGNPGDVKPVGQGVSELRVPHGPGYRVYFVQRGTMLIVVLCGGNKGSQSRDIARAQQMAAGLEE